MINFWSKLTSKVKVLNLKFGHEENPGDPLDLFDRDGLKNAVCVYLWTIFYGFNFSGSKIGLSWIS